MMKNFEHKIRQLSQEEKNELSNRLKLLLTIGKQTEGTSPVIDISLRPPYFNEKHFDQAQKTLNEYYLSIAMASSIGLMLLIQLDEILTPLLITGKSRTVSDLYSRYSATAKYMKCCYETPFYDSSSEGWKHVNIVRSMHKRIYKFMNENEQYRKLIKNSADRDNKEYVWVNQFDMAITQFAFIGMFLLRPDKCGAPNITQEEIGQIVYFWRLLSYQFGIEDRFNIFVYHDDLAKQLSFMDMIFNQYKLRLEEPRNRIGVEMAKGITLAFEDLSRDITFNTSEHHWFDVISLSGRKELLPYNNLGERLRFARFKFVMNLSSRNRLFRQFMVRAYKKKLDKFCVKSDKIKPKLAKKYSNLVYE